MTTRRRFTGEFKARVAVEALRGDKTIQEVSALHKVHPNQVSTWKHQAIEGLGAVFSNGADRELLAKIGQLIPGLCPGDGTRFLVQRAQAMSREERKMMIAPDRPGLSVSRRCELMSIGRSSFYRAPWDESAENLAPMRRIEKLFLKHPSYGSRQMVRQLRREGVGTGRRRVRRLMRPMGLEAIYQAPRTSAPNPAHRIYPYPLRGRTIDRSNQVWCADITYIPVRRGFHYPVAVMDWASRHVLAWRLSNTMDAGFCVEALIEAPAKYGRPDILNIDQGSQFTSLEFTGVLKDAGVAISMDGRGRCLDNIFIEWLWRSLKYEAVYLREVTDGLTVDRVIGAWPSASRGHAARPFRTARVSVSSSLLSVATMSQKPSTLKSPQPVSQLPTANSSSPCR